MDHCLYCRSIKDEEKCFKFLHQDPGLAGRESKTILQTHGSGDFKFVPRT